MARTLAAGESVEISDADAVRGAGLGLIVCGGNVTEPDVRGWVDRLLATLTSPA